MTEDRAFLDTAYGLDAPEKTHDFYRKWAATYDAEVMANGYVSPGRSAAALVACGVDVSAPLLDLGCGTGLSGEALRAAGFTTIDGTDFSAEMLEAARTKGVYRRLTQGDLNDPIPAVAGQYANIAAIGVFSPGHAPAEMIDRVLGLLPPGGHFVFTLNDHALQEKVYQERVEMLTEAGRAEMVFSEYGDHLTARKLGSQIIVLRRP